MNTYKVENKNYDTITEAKKAARDAMIGRHHDDYVLVYEWQESGPEIGGGFWEPVSRAEYKGNKIICK